MASGTITSTAKEARRHRATARALQVLTIEAAEAAVKVERLQSIIGEMAKAHGVAASPAECA